MGFCPQCGAAEPLVEVGVSSRAAAPAAAVTLTEAKEGSHERVASEIARYRATGYDTFILDVPESPDELEHIGAVFELAEAVPA